MDYDSVKNIVVGLAGENNIFLQMTIGVGIMLAMFVGIAVLIWAAIMLLGTTGYFKILRHETVDLNAKVKSWKEVEVSDKSKNSDYTGPRMEVPLKLPFTEPLFGHMIKDPRNLPLLHVMVSSTCVLYPMAIAVYFLFMYANFAVAAVFGFGIYQFVRVNFFMDSMLHFRHFSSHSPLFKIKAMNYLSNLYLDPIMGIPPLVFLLHHISMHHIANNGFYDISSTEQYQRDSWVAFANYWFRFQVMAYLELPLFAFRTRRLTWFFAAVSVIGSFFYFLVYLTENYSGWATFCVFGLPWMIDHADDGKRNWCQHMFAVQYDSKAPAKTFWDVNCGLAYNLVDSLENREQFNEGYHVVHHAHGGAHWSTIPDLFYQHVERMASYNEGLWCLTFVDSSIWEVWLHVASDKLPQLVKNKYVYIPTAARPEPPTVGEVVAELKARLKPLDWTKRKANEPMTQQRKRWQRQKSLYATVRDSIKSMRTSSVRQSVKDFLVPQDLIKELERLDDNGHLPSDVAMVVDDIYSESDDEHSASSAGKKVD